MQFAEIVNTSGRVAGTRRRLEKIRHLATLLAQLEPAERAPAVAFLVGQLRQGRIGIGQATLRQALTVPPAEPAALSVCDVDRAFAQIADVSGSGSTTRRVQLVQGLLSRATGEEQHFLARLMMGELRQGALEGVMVEAIAQAAAVSAGSARRAAMLAGDLGAVAAAALGEGAAGLAQFRIQIFRPLQPMLAQGADDVAEALEQLGSAALEFKLDGARIQVHKADDEVRVFSRGNNDVTAAVPEVVEQVRGLPASCLILDGEVLALRPDGRPHPFQTTMRRFGRKLDIEAMRSQLPLTPFFFDCLLVDDAAMIDEECQRRIDRLTESLPAELLMPRLVPQTRQQAEDFLQRALAQGHEGVMAKSLKASYEAGSRGQSWLKIKPAHTLDLVVLAAEWGSGRRRGWLSNLHLGARDPESGGFAMIGKTFKGLTDATLAWQTEQLLARETGRDAYTVHVRPELVVEIAFNEVQTSPHYASGLALRFARVKGYRADKRALEADTIDTVRAIHAGLRVPR